MDNEYNYDAYDYGKASGNKDIEEPYHQESYSEVNFIMKESEPEYTYREEEDKRFSRKRKFGNSRKSRKQKKWITCICMAIVFGLVASATFQVSNRVVDGILGSNKKESQVINTTPVSTNTETKVLSDVSEVAENVMPSVVAITSLTVQEVQSFFFGGGYTQQYESSGSGIIIKQNDSELLIVTNNHVVEGSSALTVTFMDDKSVEAHIKGTNSEKDLAIVSVPLSKIEKATLDKIKLADLGDSDALVVGEATIAIGNALGYGQSVTNGIVSALNRTIEGFDSKLIQTNAAINPGNSGGALLNANGEVIGINTVKVNADAVEGMGYAIPISDVADILNDLMNRETRTKVDEEKRGTLGIQGETVDETVQRYGLPKGVYINEVIKGGAVEKAGISKGSIITKFDGNVVEKMEDLQSLLTYYKAGEKVEVVVAASSTNGKYVEKTYEVTLGKQSDLN